jgi:hypothetical protein
MRYCCKIRSLQNAPDEASLHHTSASHDVLAGSTAHSDASLPVLGRKISSLVVRCGWPTQGRWRPHPPAVRPSPPLAPSGPSPAHKHVVGMRCAAYSVKPLCGAHKRSADYLRRCGPPTSVESHAYQSSLRLADQPPGSMQHSSCGGHEDTLKQPGVTPSRWGPSSVGLHTPRPTRR